MDEMGGEGGSYESVILVRRRTFFVEALLRCPDGFAGLMSEGER